MLLPCSADGLIDRCEVRIDPQLQAKFGSGMLREVREVNILVNTVGNISCNF